MGKQNAYIHTVEFYSALKRNDIYDATKWINVENMGESSCLCCLNKFIYIMFKLHST